MVKNPGPGPQNPLVALVFHVEHRPRLVSENQVGRAQLPERLDGPVAFRFGAASCWGRGPREREDPLGLGRFEHGGRVGRHDHLPVPLLRDSTHQRIDVPLEDYVLVGVGFVQEEHRAAPPVEEGKEENHLKRAATRARKIKRPLPTGLPVLRPDVRLRRRVCRFLQLDPKEVADMADKGFPRGPGPG